MNDSATWQLFQAGSREAFARIYAEQYEALLNYGRRFSLDVAIIEDAIQDTFLDLWQYRATLTDVKSVRFYLLRVLRNKLNQQFKKQQSVGFTVDDNLPFDVEYSFESQLIQQQIQEETLRQLRLCLNELSPRQKEILYLRFFNGLDYEQIAEVMNLTYQATRNQLYLALKALRERLAPYWSSLLVTYTLLFS